MGYRSDVYVGMAVKDFPYLREQVGKRDGAQEYIIDEWVIEEHYGQTDWQYTDDAQKTLEHDSFFLSKHHGLDYVWFHIGGIKWYDSYEPIRNFHEAIEESGEVWGMIIIGEELDDIKSYGDPWDLEMNVARYVEQPGMSYQLPKPAEIKTDSLPPECGFPVNWVRIG